MHSNPHELVSHDSFQGKDLVICKSMQAFLLLKRNALLGLAVSLSNNMEPRPHFHLTLLKKNY